MKCDLLLLGKNINYKCMKPKCLGKHLDLKDNVHGQLRVLHKELQHLYRSPSAVKIVKSRKL